jgi:hypothetical protein
MYEVHENEGRFEVRNGNEIKAIKDTREEAEDLCDALNEIAKDAADEV